MGPQPPMELIPPDTDICVHDLDEVFRPGWRKLPENAWEPEQNSPAHPYLSFGPAERRALRSCRRKSTPRRVPLASSGT